MQSVVTVQAPIALDRNITSGGKQIKTEHNARYMMAQLVHRVRWIISWSRGDVDVTHMYTIIEGERAGSASLSPTPPRDLMKDLMKASKD